MTNNSDCFKITISVFENGLQFVRKSNWNGLGITFLRNQHKKARDNHSELERRGIYILLGVKNRSDIVYVGETDDMHTRLGQHHADEEKEFWRKTVIFTRESDTDPLNKSETKYLEARLCQIAGKNEHCELANKNMPKLPTMSKCDVAAVETYLREILSLLPNLGIIAFTEAVPAERHKYYYFKSQRTNDVWDAKGYEDNGGFVVTQRSKARITTNKILQANNRLREELIENGVLRKKENHLEFTRDYRFDYPSSAASVVSGGNYNGLDYWKDKSDGKGKSINENRKAEVKSDDSKK